MKYFSKLLILFFLIGFASLAHAEIKVYFSPDGGCQAAVVEEINKAHKSIDAAVYSFTSREIAQALVKARQRQVKIRIILDIDQVKDQHSKSRYLISKGLNVRFHMGQGLMHDKFAVIDGKVVLSGSFNWTVSADRRNDENLLVMPDYDLAQQYAKDFKLLWSQSGEGQLKDLQSSE